MASIDFSDEDREKAELFLENFLSDQIPEGDFSKGTSLRDHTIKAIASVYAVIKKEISNVKNANSLRQVSKIEDDREFTQAVENLVSNWFVQRRSGRKVRGTVTLHFSQPHDGRVPVSTRFTKQPGATFELQGDESLYYEASDLSPRVNSEGEITSYTISVPVIAEHVGTAYEVSEGRFVNVTDFSTFFIRAENETAFSGARDPESPEELLERVPESITKRDMSSNRSINAILRDEFTDIDRVLVQGMGDTAMRRDVLQDDSNYFNFHLGGHTDVYVSTPLREEVTFEAEVGSYFNDPRREVLLFEDEEVRDWRTMVSTGDILRVYNSSTSDPSRYRIERVTKHFLEVSDRQPFPSERPVELREGEVFSSVRVTSSNKIRCVNAQFDPVDVDAYVRVSGSNKGNDGTYHIESVDREKHTVSVREDVLTEEDAGSLRIELMDNVVDYSIGNAAGDYDNKLSRRRTGRFSNRYREVGRVALPNRPLYKIREVSISAPEDPEANPLTGRIEFEDRINTSLSGFNSFSNEYRLISRKPQWSPSSEQMMLLDLRPSEESKGNRGVIDSSEEGGIFEVEDPVFSEENSAGKSIFISHSSYEENRGELSIKEVLSSSEVRVDKPYKDAWSPHPESRVSWEYHDRGKFDGKTVRVVYDTVEQFDAINSFVRSTNNHIPCADTLVKAFHPVYLSFDLNYRVRENAEALLNEREAVNFITSYINDYPETEIITVSDLVSEFYSEYKSIVSKVRLPLKVYYTLHSPDGRVIRYKSEDDISINSSYLVGETEEDRLTDPKSLGVTEQTVRYIADETLIDVNRVNQ